jgi:hypothetical protein
MKKIAARLASFLCFSLLFIQCDTADLFPKDPSSKILGKWLCKETSEVFGNNSFEISITRSGNLQEVLLANFYQMGNSYEVKISLDSQDMIISEQTVDGYTISGDGTISSEFNEIELYYQVDDHSGPIDHVTATLTKN